jgi:hypothetical protein
MVLRKVVCRVGLCVCIMVNTSSLIGMMLFICSGLRVYML